MQYIVQTPEGAAPVSIEPTASEHVFRVQLGDAPAITVEAAFLADHALSLQLEGRQYLAQLEAGAAEIKGERVAGEVLSLRSYALRHAAENQQNSAGPAAVAAPMAGRIARLTVADGEVVEKGQPLLVIEAMKMENELVAPRAGRICGLTAQAGLQVDMHAPLCRIE